MHGLNRLYCIAYLTVPISSSLSQFGDLWHLTQYDGDGSLQTAGEIESTDGCAQAGEL
jgi:hypothetical protein